MYTWYSSTVAESSVFEKVSTNRLQNPAGFLVYTPVLVNGGSKHNIATSFNSYVWIP